MRRRYCNNFWILDTRFEFFYFLETTFFGFFTTFFLTMPIVDYYIDFIWLYVHIK